MKISSIEIENFKSIKNKEKLHLTDGVSKIIGKNESGKSNVLDAIGNINLDSPSDKKVIKKPNTKAIDKDTIVALELELNNEQKSLLKVKSDTSVIRFNTLEPNFRATIESGFQKEYFSKHEYTTKLTRLKKIVDEYIDGNNQSIQNQIKERINLLENLSILHGVSWNTNISYIRNKVSLIKEELIREECTLLLLRISEYIEKLYNELPTIVFYREQELKSEYKFSAEDFGDIEAKHGKPLLDFMKAVKFESYKMKDLIFSPSSDLRRDLKDELIENIDKYINEEFNKFYEQESVRLTIDISGQTMNFFVKSSKSNINISERSNGLKWYMNLFISITANRNNDLNKMLLIIDEPGVYLHVDAQIELRNLLYKLSEKHQILYSTHSPFMIDASRITDVRVIQKEMSGQTNIINNVFSDKIINTSKLETLSPLLNSLGVSNPYMFGVSYEKINVVTEGITDALYLRTFAELLNESRFVFMPSTGARNVHLLSTILWSWNLKYIALFDNDTEGRKAKEAFERQMGNTETHLITIDDSNYDLEIEDLIDEADLKMIGIDVGDIRRNKRLAAIKIIDFIKEDFDKVTNITKDNYKKLFRKLANKA